MGLTAFLLTYLLGGITFLPLVLIAVLVHAHLVFPRRQGVQSEVDRTGDDLVQPGDDMGPLRAAQKELKDEAKRRPSNVDPEVAAGYFAVCREYTPMGINAKPIERSTPVGSTTVAAPSPSVYQTMYRSIFDRKQAPGPLDNGKSISQRPKKAGNVFYVVLRHGHLMLFDDDEQLEVRHVISLAHHDVSIYSGGGVTPEGELFIKRNALCLLRRTEGVNLAPDSQLSKPFYLFSENCSAKEDFYFAMLRNQEQAFPAEGRAPSPLQFDVKHIISLVQKLHSSEEHIQSRWFNAMLGRLFLGIYRTADLESLIREKLTKKISRVKRPAFLSSIEIRKIDTGDSAPYFTNLRHKDLTVEGECSMEADVRYTGNFRLEVAAVARIDLGSRLKAREVDLVLSVALRKLDGHALFKIKPPPSNRVWFSFSQMPKVEMTIEPIVSSRQITYTVILRQIESRIKEVIAETLVLPFWDDTPFFKTEHKKWRGGIFAGDDAVESLGNPEAATAQADDIEDAEQMETAGTPPHSGLLPMEKSQSVPVLDSVPPAGLFGRKPGSRSSTNQPINSPLTDLNASSTSIDIKNEVPVKQGSERSSSFVAESTPIVGTEAVNAVLSKPSSPPGESLAASTMAKLNSKSHTWTPAGISLQSHHRDSIISNLSSRSSVSSRGHADKEGRATEEMPKPLSRRGTGSSAGSIKGDIVSSSSSPAPSIKGSVKSQPVSFTRGLFMKRENTTSSGATTSANHADDSSKRISLAAVSNAAGAAKRWGWNALQRHGDTTKHGHHSEIESRIDLSKPMGGGRPLPPPGVPLPMPEKKTRTAPAPAPRRKPVPPPQLPERQSAQVRAQEIKRRPVPTPPFPPRRKRPDNENCGAGDGDMLVVAAPLTDSEPPSPGPDESTSYMHPWVEDADDEDDLDYNHPGESPSSEERRTPPVLPPRDMLSNSSAVPREETEQHDGPDSDDEYTAWMDNPGEDETDPNADPNDHDSPH